MGAAARALMGAAVAAIFLTLGDATHRNRRVSKTRRLQDETPVCRDPQRNLTVAPGDVAPLADGQCGRLLCDAGARYPRFVVQECERVLDSSCKVEPGNPEAPYPVCCDQITCAGHKLLHGKCVNTKTQETYEKGATWPLTNGECGYTECKGYFYNAASGRPSWRFQKTLCGDFRPSAANCTHEEGIEGAPFPECCPRMMCDTRRRFENNVEEKSDKYSGSRDLSGGFAQGENTVIDGSADTKKHVSSGNETLS